MLMRFIAKHIVVKEQVTYVEYGTHSIAPIPDNNDKIIIEGKTYLIQGRTFDYSDKVIEFQLLELWRD